MLQNVNLDKFFIIESHYKIINAECYFLHQKLSNSLFKIIKPTVFLHELLPSENLDFLNADEVAKEICPENIESVKIKAGKIVLSRLEKLLNTEKSFAIETTLSGKNHIKTIERAKKIGYQVVLIYSYLDSPILCENRIKIRVLNGGHNIPKEDIIRRFYRSKKNFWNIYKNLVDEWNLFYNGNSEYILVAQYSNNDIEIFNENLYNEFIKDLK